MKALTQVQTLNPQFHVEAVPGWGNSGRRVGVGASVASGVAIEPCMVTPSPKPIVNSMA